MRNADKVDWRKGSGMQGMAYKQEVAITLEHTQEECQVIKPPEQEHQDPP